MAINRHGDIYKDRCLIWAAVVAVCVTIVLLGFIEIVKLEIDQTFSESENILVQRHRALQGDY